MSKIALSLGPLSITWYSICILLGVIVAGIIINTEAKKFNISPSFVTNLIFWVVIFGIAGARVYYVLFNLDYYSVSPIEAIKVWNGGLAIHGGIIAGLITVLWYCKKYDVNPLRMLDIAAPGVLIAQAIGRWGNFFNAEAHGGVVTKAFLENLHLPKFIIKGMYINGNYYHPTFLYESIFCTIGFVIILILRRMKWIKQGNVFSIYLIWYGTLRFFIESLRTDSLMLFNFKTAQIISIIMIIIGIYLIIRPYIRRNYDKQKVGHSTKR